MMKWCVHRAAAGGVCVLTPSVFDPCVAWNTQRALGWNCRMTNLQAACGVAQLEVLDETMVRKREIGLLYGRLLEGVPGLKLPPDCDARGELNSYWVYAVVLDVALGIEADTIMRKLGDAKIGTRPFFWPMHEQPVLLAMGHCKGVNCPKAENFARLGFYLPSGIALTDVQIQRVASVLRSVMADVSS